MTIANLPTGRTSAPAAGEPFEYVATPRSYGQVDREAASALQGALLAEGRASLGVPFLWDAGRVSLPADWPAEWRRGAAHLVGVALYNDDAVSLAERAEGVVTVDLAAAASTVVISARRRTHDNPMGL